MNAIALSPTSPLHDAVHLQAIAQSHERCAAIGLSRQRAPELSLLGRADLALARERLRRLHLHAAPVMEMLFEQVVQTQSMVLLTDACGTVIHSVGDAEFVARASRVALQPGADWSEPNKGTNAIGTALVAGTATLVHADEHFVQAHQFLTCSAVPIHDPRGNVLGVIDVTGDHRLQRQHTMGLVQMSARMIENHWLVDDFRDVIRLHLHPREDCIGTLREGIVALSAEGRILGANRAALEMFGHSAAALRMHSLTSLLGVSVGALVDHFRAPLAPPLALWRPSGERVHARAAFGLLTGLALGAAAAAEGEPIPAVPAPAATGVPVAAKAKRGSGGLRALDTGDAQVRTLIAKLRKVIDRPIPILVSGETGTGKELLARAIHDESSRAAMPFVAVNCAAIPETLIEAELFGHEEGAFTGARRKGASGRIAQAHGGTLFLDEIGDMPLALQARLLRVLQERQVTPLGGQRAIPVDLQIVSASHRDLRTMMRAQTFREDLYYRLNGLAVKLPPLRERSDLAALIHKLLAECGMHPPPRLDTELQRRFATYAWPGNLRQLHSVLRTAAAMAGPEASITAAHLPDDLLEEMCGAPVGAAAAPARPALREAPPAAETLQQAELDVIRRAVAEAGGNISAAAKRLGIARNTIYRKLHWCSGADEAA